MTKKIDPTKPMRTVGDHKTVTLCSDGVIDVRIEGDSAPVRPYRLDGTHFFGELPDIENVPKSLTYDGRTYAVGDAVKLRSKSTGTPFTGEVVAVYQSANLIAAKADVDTNAGVYDVRTGYAVGDFNHLRLVHAPVEKVYYRTIRRSRDGDGIFLGPIRWETKEEIEVTKDLLGIMKFTEVDGKITAAGIVKTY